jgi:hypothetical protein
VSAERSQELLSYLRVLTVGAGPGQFLDIRWGNEQVRMRRRAVRASNPSRAAELITRVSRQMDVYVGVALRDYASHGGKAAISGSRLLYVESDDPNTPARLTIFPHAPSVVVSSGTPGHLHLYWQLHEVASPLQVENANRRLALALGGDPACTGIAHVLRPPSTLNHKHHPARAVRLLAHFERATYTLAELIRGLPPDDRPAAPVTAAVRHREGATDEDLALLEIPAEEYVRVLAERSPNRAGKVLCPFHTERDPSLQLYPDGTFYCFGASCRRGGTIFDFAAHLWGITPRGRGFIELRERLLEQLHPGRVAPRFTPTAEDGSRFERHSSA